MLIAFGMAAAVGGVALLRHRWSLPARSWRGNAFAWASIVAGTLLGAAGAGAWGIATVALAPTIAALLLLGHAGVVTPAARARASDRRAHVLPDAGEPLRLGGRLLTFAIVVPLAFAASLVVGVALRGLAGVAGWREADGNVLALFAVPLCWSLLMLLLAMEARRTRQLLILAVPALVGGSMLLAGGA